MLGDVTKKRRGAPQDMDSAHAGLANGLHKPKPGFDGGLASQALTATFGSKRQGEAHGAPASKVHSHPDRGREVHTIKIAACQPAGDLRPQEAAISLNALRGPIADHGGERIERTSAARRRKAAIRARARIIIVLVIVIVSASDVEIVPKRIFDAGPEHPQDLVLRISG